jgi:hypothetical protein
MKKTLLIIGGIFLFIIIALALVPFLFKDKIKAKIDSELAKTVNAEILYDVDKFSLTVFRNFPNITMTIDDFGLVGKQEEFKGDTLFKAKTMRFVADIMSVVSGDKIKVKGIYLNKPKIVTLTAKNGKNSWDLMIANPEDTLKKTGEEELTEFSVALEKWEIEDGQIIYDDASLPMYAQLNHVDHKGTGDITQEVVDMKTYTKSPDVLVTYDGITYLEKHAVVADMAMNMNYVKGEYKFLENECSINDFKFGFDGLIAMGEKDMRLDLTFKANETEFKNLLSLVPGVFLKDYEKIKTNGKIAFDGYVKGIYSDKAMPAYGLNLKVNDAMLQYPDLPTAVTNIAADMSIENKDGITDNMIIDVRKFHMDMGKNPVDAKVLMEGLNPSKVDANVIARVNLAEMTQIYPIEGTTLKGLYNLDLKAKGIYSDKQWPVMNAVMSLKEGFVKTKDFPEPLEKLNFDAVVTNNSASLSTVKVVLNNFNMLLQGEPFQMKALVENLEDPHYDVALRGIIDMTKLTKIYPLDDMTVSGRINADIQTKGIMSDVQAGKYGNTATSGTMAVTNLKYASKDLPKGMALSSANFSFTPEKMNILNMNGTLGKSDINVKGYFANYMGYLFGKQDTVIRGNMTFASNKFDVNEWMSDDKSAAQPKPNDPLEVFEVPKDIDFLLASDIKTVLYDNMTLSNMNGNIIMKDGIVRMDKVAFNTLGGSFLTNGTYNTQNIEKPLFDFKLDIKDMKIQEAYSTFNTIKALAPAAKNVSGNVNTTLSINGLLGKDMMPVYSTLTGSGLAQILAATVSGNKMLQGIGKLTNLNSFDPMNLKNIIMKFKIQDGKLLVEPFDLNAGGVKMNIGGANSLDGGIDYGVKLDVPAGALGASVNGAMSKLTGKTAANAENIKLDLKVGGTYDSPKVSLLSSSVKEQAQEQVKEAVKEKVKEEIKNSEQVQKAQAEAERIRKETEDRARQEQERLKKEAEERAKKEGADVIKDKLKKLPKF